MSQYSRCYPDQSVSPSYFGGLNKREFFAAMAMHALLGDVAPAAEAAEIARHAVEVADLLVEALNREVKP